ncbi:Asp-tRNA(Asn)/Glu-tRNA(Gln) amidotransferase subunit GatA [Magnetospirillum sulfuroxidans]|uniref:Glutamyl-tRNA(Gln) amidotransferase subunit A n=1 Tax=Magnetospirillum sulfuroxidans TaxID=611300 RepID=A0ABS5I9L4_9PROT|nr:Asp-tRNA(Asn)/Glu-tRNA(Gln) amidotransferase subunit GatA [Magnetospirillum sulfuroxidans]MBR9971100.1 Asp-tRNA(Asn)/Glu-tRNA(Gln) amidotransferase subunit GatA [Magnetospirillum sulfuroxidans]
MTKLTNLTIAQARDKMAKGEFTALELTEAHITAMQAKRSLGAYITETAEQAREEAKASDLRRQAGQIGALEGIPLGIKDLFCTKGVQTTAASHILEGFKPPYESTVSGKLKAAGSVMLGKLNLDEFAMGSSNMTSYYGKVVNPWKSKSDPAKLLVPGGSSGGSAAAVAARIAMGATGTDTGGSIRQPAAFCGITGIKPTYGRCSRWGIVAFASSLDQAGPMARDVRDCAIMLGSMAGHDAKDSTSAPLPVPNFEAALTGDIRGLKVGIPKEYRPDGLSDEILRVWEQGIEWLKAAGATPVEISLPHTKYALPTYYIVAPAEASSNLARYDGLRFGQRVEGKTLDDMYKKSRAAGFGSEVRRRIMIGTYVLSAGYYDAYYSKAQKVRRLIAEDFTKAFQDVDVILTPTAPSAAFGMDENTDDPVTMWLNDVFTIPTSLAGLPGLSLPAGLNADGLPLGLQLIGRPFDEETVFKVAGVMESAANFTALPEGV